MCVFGGLFTIPINFALKFVPDHICPLLGDEPDEDKAVAKKEYEELIAIAEKYKAFQIEKGMISESDNILSGSSFRGTH